MSTFGETDAPESVTELSTTEPDSFIGLLKAIKNLLFLAGGKDQGPGLAASWGIGGAPFTSADIHSAAVPITDVPVSGQKIVVLEIHASSDTDLKLTFTEETSNAVIGYMRIPAGSTISHTFRGKKKLSTANKRVQCQASAAGNVEIDIGFYSEA